MTRHSLHGVIGEMLNDTFGGSAILDEACGGKHRIPLFCGEKSNTTNFCDIDAIIVKEGQIRAIIEIEESNVKPTHIFGKFLTSAVSKHHEYKEDKYTMADNVIFIQILKEKAGKPSKQKQCLNIAEKISSILPLKDSRITKYKIIYGNEDDFHEGGDKRKELLDELKTIIHT